MSDRYSNHGVSVRKMGLGMAKLTVTLSDETLAQLREKADRFRVMPEDLLRVSVEELLSRPDEAFQSAMDHVLTKNAELYRRLASA